MNTRLPRRVRHLWQAMSDRPLSLEQRAKSRHSGFESLEARLLFSAVDYVAITWEENGVDKEASIQSGGSINIDADPGTFTARIWADVQDASPPYQYYYADVNNGKSKDVTYNFAYSPGWGGSDFGPLDTQILFGVNTTFGQVQVFIDWIQLAGPDLVVSNINVDGATSSSGVVYDVGEEVDVSGIVFNTGDTVAGQSKVGYYLTTSRNESQLTSGNRVNSDTTSPLSQNTGDADSDSYTFESGDVGTRWFAMLADYRDDVAEADEDNNVIWWGPFTVEQPAPGTPTGANPSNGATLASPPTTLDWADTSGADDYDVYLNNRFVANVTASEWDLNQSLNFGFHTWQVVANNAGGSTQGPLWNFTIQQAAPGTPSLPNPSDGATLASAPITLDWADTSGADDYDVFLNGSLVDNVTTSQWDLNQPLSAGLHTWRVVASNAGGSTTGPFWDFTIKPPDDHGDNSFNATTVSVNTSTPGSIEVIGDEDWFKFTATSGYEYEFEIIDLGLSASELTLYDTNGAVPLINDDDSGSGSMSKIWWTAPTSSDYYLKVIGEGSIFTGNYGLSLSEIVPPSEVTRLSFVDSIGTPVDAINTGDVVYVKVEGVNLADQVLDIQVREEDGIVDEAVDTISVTVSSNGIGIAPWTASRQDNDISNPNNIYYLYYDNSPLPLTGDIESDSVLYIAPPNTIADFLPKGEASIGTNSLKGIGVYAQVIGGSGEPAIQNKPTWFVMHGRTSSAEAPEFQNLATTISEITDDQVILIDWTTGSYDNSDELLVGIPLLQGSEWIPKVADWVYELIDDNGLSGDQLRFVGHSWGSYLAHDTAALISGGVQSLVALDPAQAGSGYGLFPENVIDFAEVSDYSWGFYGEGSFGSAPLSETTDAAFYLSFDNGLPVVLSGERHGAPIRVFDQLLKNNGDAQLSTYFTSTQIATGFSAQQFEPWGRDQFEAGGLVDIDIEVFEGRITVTDATENGEFGHDWADIVKLEFVDQDMQDVEILSTIPAYQPEIDIEIGSTDSVSTYTFGQVTVGQSASQQFIVRNEGTADLIVSQLFGLTSPFSISSTNDSGSGDDWIIAPSSTQRFTVTYAPTAEGSDSDILTLVNNDDNESNYQISLSGSGVAVPVPDIDVQRDGLSGVTSFDFGPVPFDGTPLAELFTVRNNGNADLNVIQAAGLTSSFSVTPVNGSGSADDWLISPGGSQAFTIIYQPNALGVQTDTLQLLSNDPDEAVYELALSGTGVSVPAPEIDVRGLGVSITDGDTTPDPADGTEFGLVDVGASSPVIRTFTIHNMGDATLDLTGTPVVQITGSPAFTVSRQPDSNSVAPAGSVSFEISYDPSSDTGDTATVAIANSDSDEDPFNFDIQGLGTITPTAPEIDIRGLTISIPDGDTTPDQADGTDFGVISIVANPLVRTFVIHNMGDAVLELTGSPIVQIPVGSAFSVSSQPPSSSIAPGGSVTFDIAFDPAMPGSDTATVTMANSDSDEDPYTFVVSGERLDPVSDGDPVAHYRFDGDAQDSSGNGLNATLSGGSFSDGVIGQGLSLPESNDFASIPDSPLLDLGDEMSVAFWVRPDSWSYGGGGDGGWLVSKLRSGENNSGWEIHLRRSSPSSDYMGVLEFDVAGIGALRSTATIEPGRFYHVAVVMSQSGDYTRIYQDGVIVAEREFIGIPGTNNHPVYIGSHLGIADRQVNGVFDDLRIYDSALSESEVTRFATNLVAHYDFKGSLENQSSDQFDGTIAGSAIYSNGAEGSGLYLDGSSYVSLGDGFDDLPEMSAAFWFRADAGTIGSSAQRLFTKHVSGDGFASKSFSLIVTPQNQGANPGQLNLRVYDNDGYYGIEGGPTIQDDQWYHVAMTYEAGEMRLYLDGDLVGATSQKLNVSSSPVSGDVEMQDTTTETRIGASVGTSERFQGYIDELYVHDRVLSESEVLGLYNAGSGLLWSVDATVEGDSNPWLAGMPDGTPDFPGSGNPTPDTTPNQSPELIQGISITDGSILEITATGLVRVSGNAGTTGPDGNPNNVTFHGTGPQYGISNTMIPANALVGVFLEDGQPDQFTAPVGLDFTIPSSRDYLQIDPEVRQTFFIGDGLTSTGLSQRIIVPDGATRLYLGTMDGSDWQDNIGSYEVQITQVSTQLDLEPDSNPWLAGMPDGTPDYPNNAVQTDFAPAQSPQLIPHVLQEGAVLEFSATGTVRVSGNAGTTGPDGNPNNVTMHGNFPQYGISTASIPANALVGVFLENAQPAQLTPPSALDFTSIASRDYTELAPEVRQPFFIGDGLTSTGDQQRIVVPTGGARLYLGTMDGSDWQDNSGGFDVDIWVVGDVFIPGDTDGDGDIDDADLGTSFSNYTGALVPGTGGKTFSDGDTDGDGDVDDADLGTSFSGYTGALAPDALEQGPSMLPSSETTGLLSEKQEQEQVAWMFYDKQQAATSLQPVSSFSLFELRDIDEDEADYEVMYERLVAGESK